MTRKQNLHLLVKNFRILDDWKISLNQEQYYNGQVSINLIDKEAVVYDWPLNKIPPDDFYFHEVLHIALKAAGIKHKHEEHLIQDICSVYVSR